MRRDANEEALSRIHETCDCKTLLPPSTNQQQKQQRIIPELSNETRFFTFQPFYDHVEPFEVDLFPVFSSISQIFHLFLIIWLHIEVHS